MSPSLDLKLTPRDRLVLADGFEYKYVRLHALGHVLQSSLDGILTVLPHDVLFNGLVAGTIAISPDYFECASPLRKAASVADTATSVPEICCHRLTSLAATLVRCLRNITRRAKRFGGTRKGC